MWSWDSTKITHDQTCWTYDGYDGCTIDSVITSVSTSASEIVAGGTNGSPIGPGFFIFFQYDISEKVSQKPIIGQAYQDSSKRLHREDEELLLIIQLAVTHKLI